MRVRPIAAFAKSGHVATASSLRIVFVYGGTRVCTLMSAFLSHHLSDWVSAYQAMTRVARRVADATWTARQLG